MTGRRRSWFRGSPDNEWMAAARTATTAAFLDMDRRQSAAQSGVNAAEVIYPERRFAGQWAPARAACYDASAQYLEFTTEMDAAERDGTTVPNGQERADALVRTLTAAAEGVDDFYRPNTGVLQQAAATLAAMPQLVATTRAAAQTQLTAAQQSPYAGYPSVRSGALAVEEAMLLLDSADPAAAVDAARAAVSKSEQATAELAEALAAAPAREDEARKAIASVTTRLDAVRTRSEGLGPAYSAILREFNAASSADLTQNDSDSRRAVEAATTELTEARTAAGRGDPESALASTTAAREHLAVADALVDAVTRRLALLREVRADPDRFARDVRFRLRDAQMLAVDRGLVDSWGSTLDAQAERLDRIRSELTGRHPDYWAYATELDTVTEFLGGVVERMRKEVRPQQD